MSDSLQLHVLWHARLTCPSLSSGVCSNSCPLSWWYYLTISSSTALFFFCLQSFPASWSFPVELTLRIRWPKYWSFGTSPSNEYSGWISFRIDWFDLLAVQGTLKNLLQQQSSKSSILQCLAFFMVQLSWKHWNYFFSGSNGNKYWFISLSSRKQYQIILTFKITLVNYTWF